LTNGSDHGFVKKNDEFCGSNSEKNTNPQTGNYPTMNVLFDHQAFTGTPYGGVSRYFFDLMRSFVSMPGITFDLSLRLSNNEYLNQSSLSKHIRYPAFAGSPSVNRAASLLNRQNSRQKIKAGQFDVFHPTQYHQYFLDILGSKPFVATFYDATNERYAEQYPHIFGGHYETRKAVLQQASRIIAISEFSKEELLRYFPVEANKIDIIHLGTTLGEHRAAAAALPRPLAAPYLLFVGKRDFYKNFDGFFRAIQPLMHRHPDLHLICAGSGQFRPDEQALFQAAHLDSRVHYRTFTDVTLLNLYQHAEAFVFPSLNEGFGIPVLEAFIGGCPAVLSNRSSLPEVAADAAVYFDPDQDESIAEAIERVLTDSSLRASLRKKGTDRLSQFSCDKTARQTLAVYQSLC